MKIRCVLVVLFLANCAPAAAPGWKLVWHDEFDGSTLDTAKWNVVIGGKGFGNRELEYYTGRPQNVFLENGMLIIQAIKENYKDTDGIEDGYTSGRIRTQGKFSQCYGRFEARIKIPEGQGIWPAFWMMGDNSTNWPDRGEIDIMENIGKEPATVHGTIHGPGYSGSKGIGSQFTLTAGRKFADDFHVYAVEWEPRLIRWYVDEHLYKTVTPGELPAGARWVYDQPFSLLLNVAVGGNWPGNPDDTTVFPQMMYVDYVRVYERE